MNRRLREVVVVGLVIASLASVVVAAVHADGRTSIRAETNDGGAWLVRRSDGVVGQLNRASGEVTGVVRVANPRAAFDVEQTGNTIVVHDADAGEVQVIDPRTYQIVNTVSLPGGVAVRALDDGAVVWQASPLRVWAMTRDDLAAIVSLDDVAPIVETEAAGLVTTTVDGDVVIVDVDGQRIGIGDPLTPDAWAWTRGIL